VVEIDEPTVDVFRQVATSAMQAVLVRTVSTSFWHTARSVWSRRFPAGAVARVDSVA